MSSSEITRPSRYHTSFSSADAAGPEAVANSKLGKRPDPRGSQQAERNRPFALIWFVRLGSLNSITGNPNGKRPLDAVNRDDQAAVAIRRQKEPLDAVQASSADSNPLTHI